MKLSFISNSLILEPESQAEKMQLGHLENTLKMHKIKHEAERQWLVEEIKIPLYRNDIK